MPFLKRGARVPCYDLPSTSKPTAISKGSHDLEKEVERNKGFWVERPQVSAPLLFKLNDKYTVEVPRKTKKDQGIFHRPSFLELDFVSKLANAGLLYSEEEISDSEEEVQPDTTLCLPLRKKKYKICDPCKAPPRKAEPPSGQPAEELLSAEEKGLLLLLLKKAASECQCETCSQPDFEGDVRLLRQRKMNGVMKPFKSELLNRNYDRRSPVKFMPYEFGMKRTFPIYDTSNL